MNNLRFKTSSTGKNETQNHHKSFTIWVRKNRNRAIMIGVVIVLLVFSIIRGIISDEPGLVKQTEAAKTQWELIQKSQKKKC